MFLEAVVIKINIEFEFNIYFFCQIRNNMDLDECLIVINKKIHTTPT
jgi:hypothetical protein